MAITILDIARETGKSYSAVSRALNDSPMISAATKELIRETALRLGYHPSFAGVALQKGCTNTIAVIIPELGNPFYAEFIHHLKKYTHGKLDIVVYDYEYNKEQEQRCLQKMLTGICDGIIACITSFEHTIDYVTALWKARIPLVVVGTPLLPAQEQQHDVLSVDFRNAVLEILHCLKKMGKKHIVKTEEMFTSAITDKVENDFLAILREAGFSGNKKSIFFHTSPEREDPVQAGANILAEILQLHPDTDVIFGKNGQQVYGMLQQARLLGKRIPEDLIIVSCDNTWINQYAPVPIPAIDIQLQSVAKAAYQLLARRLKSKEWLEPSCKMLHAIASISPVFSPINISTQKKDS